MKTLLIRHIPESLSDGLLKEFLEHFGATNFKKTKFSSVFAEFPDEKTATAAMSKLNHLKLLGKTLIVEKAQEKTKADPFPIARNLGIDYPSPPHLMYKYPPPNQTILENIKNTLLAVPVFYTQVLHLMNKMNLPVPFDRMSPAIPLSEGRKKRRRESSEEESYSSDEEEQEKKRQRKKLLEQVNSLKDRTRLQITHSVKPRFGPGGSVTLAKGPLEITIAPEKPSIVVPSFELEPEPVNDHMSRVATEQDISENRANISELPKFQNHQLGNPYEKIYVKNLPTDVCEDDFYWLFGRFFPDEKVMKRDLEIQIMEGRMKGQAFVTFPTIGIAEEAIQSTNGYLLRNKPVIMSFAKPPKHPPPQPAPPLNTEPPNEGPRILDY